jgi:hypothetical protein
VVAVRTPATGIAVENVGAAPLELRGRRYAPDWTGPARVEVPPSTTVPVVLADDRGSAPWQLRIAGEGARLCSLAPS